MLIAISVLCVIFGIIIYGARKANRERDNKANDNKIQEINMVKDSEHIIKETVKINTGMKIAIYIVDLIVFIVVALIIFSIGYFFVYLIYPDILNAPTGSYSSIGRVVAIFWCAWSWIIMKKCHVKIKTYVEDHDMKEAAISFVQLLGIAFVMLLHIAEWVINILFPLAVIYLAYYFLTR